MLMTVLLFLLVAAPISLLFHELGHVLGAYLMKAQKIQLAIGSGPKHISFSAGRLMVSVYSFYMLGGHTFSEREPFYSKLEQIVIAGSGPLLNGMVGFILQLFIPYNDFGILTLFQLFNFWLFITNLIPYRIGEKCSDGYTILKIMISKRKVDRM